MSSGKTASNRTAPTQLLQVNGHSYAYRRFGSGSALPLLFLQHFTGTLDVTDPLASGREVTYPDAGHGSLFQYPESFTKHAMSFLASVSESAAF